MSSISGFLGSPDDRILPILRSLLSHRGQGRLCEIRLKEGGLQSLASKPSAHEGGCHEGEIALVWAGSLTSLPPESQETPADFGSGVKGTPVPLWGVRGARPPFQDHASTEGTAIAKRLLQGYQAQGLSLFNDLRGAFVIAVYDRGRLHLIRDGAGARSLYFGWNDGRWIFAIEPKGIWGQPGFSRILRPHALAEYLTFSFIPGEKTILEGIEALQAGEIVTLTTERRVFRQRFFFFPHEAASSQAAPHPSSPPLRREPPRPGFVEDGEEDSDTAWLAAFQREFSRAVAQRLALLPSGEPWGVALSGGIDSSVVVAEMARQAPDPRSIHTFAIHFGEGYPHELPFSRMVAERCKTTHEEVLIRPRSFLHEIREMIWALDDPIGDPVTIANYELARIVSQRFGYLFNGEGGDPAFGGPKNLPMMLQLWYGGLPRSPTFLEEAYLASFRRAYEEIPKLLSPSYLSSLEHPQGLIAIVQPFLQDASSKKLLHRLTAMNLRLKGAHLILPKVERMLGRHGMIPLSPLFDERLLQLSFAMPPRLILSHGVEKIILKKAYQEDLPLPILERPKSGMRVPVHFWFQGEMRRYIRSIFAPAAVRKAGIFSYDRLQKLLDYDLDAPQGRYGIRLWMLLTFEIWRRLVLEGETL